MTLTMWLTAAVTVSVPISHPGLLAVAVLLQLQVQNCSLLLGPVFEIKQRYQNRAMGSAVASLMPCKPRCVPRLRSLPRFTKLKHRHRHRNDRRWRCETHSVSVSRWTARRYFHCLRRTITRITDKITVKCVTTIHRIDPADLSINSSD